MRFRPPHCPYPDCHAHTGLPFRYQRRGSYPRACDGRRAQRFLCLECRRSFSTQRFRLDFRLKQPGLHLRLWPLFVSKCTLRQAARVLGVNRKSVSRRLVLVGNHCRDYHRARLGEAARSGGLQGAFQLDELETFEHDRRLQPLTVPVLIQRQSLFVLDLAVAPLPCRGGLTPRHRLRKARREALHGRRRSESRRAVEQCLARLGRSVRAGDPVWLETDRKPSYVSSIGKVLGGRAGQCRFSSRIPKGRANPLFGINHTLAMLRDGVSRLVRRTWAASKRGEMLELHLWIWAAWRNYVRGITNRATRITPAMAAGVASRKTRKEELLAWRVTGRSRDALQPRGPVRSAGEQLQGLRQ